MILAILLSGLSIFCTPGFQTNGNMATCFSSHSNAYQQPVDSIAFHLYTDSLKKNVQNYINVDGLLPDGRWIPMSARDIRFTTTGGSFEGNNLVIPETFTGTYVTITATCNRNSKLRITTVISLKTRTEDDALPLAEIKKEGDEQPTKASRRKKKKGSL